MARILVVDDDESIRLLYKKELAEEGHDVVTAGDASTGLECFLRAKPDLVVLDIRMPGMSGLEALGQVLSMNRLVPVVLNTGYSYYRENFLSWLADAYIQKSSDLTELKQAVNDLLKSRLQVAVA